MEKKIRWQTPEYDQLPEDEQMRLFNEQMDDLRQLGKTSDEYLNKWYGPAGTPDRDAFDSEERARIAKPGNLDLSGLGEVVAALQVNRQVYLEQEANLVSDYIHSIAKYQRGTVLSVEPQPKKKSLYYRTATRFLVIGHQGQIWRGSDGKISDLGVKCMGVYLHPDGTMMQPDGLHEGQYRQESFHLNTNDGERILGFASDQTHNTGLAIFATE